VKSRIWAYRPELYWFGWRTLLPLRTGADEYLRHTVVLGWTITGRIVIAYRDCPGPGICRKLREAVES
jgi:hypothetical protein